MDRPRPQERILGAAHNEAVNALTFCRDAMSRLGEVAPSSYGRTWVRLRMEFHNAFCGEFIFSTRFGADFFEETTVFLEGDSFLKPVPGEKLGEYDQQFNTWLRLIRSTKE